MISLMLVTIESKIQQYRTRKSTLADCFLMSKLWSWSLRKGLQPADIHKSELPVSECIYHLQTSLLGNPVRILSRLFYLMWEHLARWIGHWTWSEGLGFNSQCRSCAQVSGKLCIPPSHDGYLVHRSKVGSMVTCCHRHPLPGSLTVTSVDLWQLL